MYIVTYHTQRTCFDRDQQKTQINLPIACYCSVESYEVFVNAITVMSCIHELVNHLYSLWGENRQAEVTLELIQSLPQDASFNSLEIELHLHTLCTQCSSRRHV